MIVVFSKCRLNQLYLLIFHKLDGILAMLILGRARDLGLEVTLNLPSMVESSITLLYCFPHH